MTGFGPVDQKRKALLLLDFQVDFLSESGRMPVSHNQVADVLSASRRAMNDAQAAGHLVVAIGNEFRSSDWLMNLLRRHAAIEGAEGTKWDDRLPLDGAIYMPKSASSAFSNPALLTLLRENDVRTVVLAGLFARACISATARDALKNGFQVEVLSGAIACASDRSRAVALDRLQRSGAQIIKRGADGLGSSGPPARVHGLRRRWRLWRAHSR